MCPGRAAPDGLCSASRLGSHHRLLPQLVGGVLGQRGQRRGLMRGTRGGCSCFQSPRRSWHRREGPIGAPGPSAPPAPSLPSPGSVSILQQGAEPGRWLRRRRTLLLCPSLVVPRCSLQPALAAPCGPALHHNVWGSTRASPGLCLSLLVAPTALTPCSSS